MPEIVENIICINLPFSYHSDIFQIFYLFSEAFMMFWHLMLILYMLNMFLSLKVTAWKICEGRFKWFENINKICGNDKHLFLDILAHFFILH